MSATTRTYATAAAAILLSALAAGAPLGAGWQIELTTGAHATIRNPTDGSTFVGGSIHGLPGAASPLHQFRRIWVTS